MKDKLCRKENNKAFREYLHELGVSKDFKSEHKKVEFIQLNEKKYNHKRN